MTDLEWQLCNWYYSPGCAVDHIVEQHVWPDPDVANWALQNSHPTRCVGLGPAGPHAPLFGHIYDHFAGLRVSQRRSRHEHVPANAAGLREQRSEAIVGTHGRCCRRATASRVTNALELPGAQDNNPYQAEHVALINSIRDGRPINDLKNVTKAR